MAIKPHKMNNAELYHINNPIQRRDALQCLEEYGKEIKWKDNDATVIDIGCGDGGVTMTILKTFIPNNCKKLVGCDISEKMVQFANAHYARDFISFIVLDIGGDLPDQLREKFDHVFSFSALHWTKPQNIAFSNIYELMVKGGNFLLMFMGRNSIYDIFRELALFPRWNYWLRDLDGFVSAYHDSQDPAKDVKLMMKSIGFTDVEVKCQEKVFVFTDAEEFKNSVKSVNTFKIPSEMQEVFDEDLLKVVHDLKLVDNVNSNEDDSVKVKLTYKLIIAYGKNNDIRGGRPMFNVCRKKMDLEEHTVRNSLPRYFKKPRYML